MASNISTMSHTKHTDVRYKYVNDYVKNDVIKIIFNKSAENESDTLTKPKVLSCMRSTQKW